LASGGYIDLLNPDREAIRIQDIARGLSHTARFGGQSPWPYSVAQHSVLMSRLIEPEFAVLALLHDAAEAYLGDVQRPLKALLPEYRAIEANFEGVIADKYSLPWFSGKKSLRYWDLRMLATEKIQVLGTLDYWISTAEVDPAEVRIKRWGPEQAYSRFMARARELRIPGAGKAES
jgi:hypothetical protein